MNAGRIAVGKFMLRSGMLGLGMQSNLISMKSKFPTMS